MTKFEFASPEWIEECFRLFREVAAKNPDVRFRLCEVFTNVPERVNPGAGGRVAWHGVIENGKAELALGELPAEDVDLKTIGDWNALLPAARWKLDLTDPEDLERFRASTEKAAEDGLVERFGDPSRVPPAFFPIHNELAERTA